MSLMRKGICNSSNLSVAIPLSKQRSLFMNEWLAPRHQNLICTYCIPTMCSSSFLTFFRPPPSPQFQHSWMFQWFYSCPFSFVCTASIRLPGSKTRENAFKKKRLSKAGIFLNKAKMKINTHAEKKVWWFMSSFHGKNKAVSKELSIRKCIYHSSFFSIHQANIKTGFFSLQWKR